MWEAVCERIRIWPPTASDGLSDPVSSHLIGRQICVIQSGASVRESKTVGGRFSMKITNFSNFQQQ